MAGGIKAPQRFPCPSQFKEPVNVNLYDKRNFTDVIQPRIWRYGDDPGFSEWACKGSYKRETGMSQSERVIRDGSRLELCMTRS